MISRNVIARLFFTAAVALGVSVTPAKAGLLPVSVTVQPEAGNFSWTYSVVLPTNVQLQAGDYFTVYDFSGYVKGTATVTSAYPSAANAANWSVAASLTPQIPAHLNPVDNTTIPSLTWTYNGPTINPAGQVTLGNFSAISMYKASTTGYFTATSTVTTNGQTDANITETLIPTGSSAGAPPGVPEPTTLALAGLGLPFIGFVRSIRRKKK
ncbi:MAG TPA: PEP-CTERM sorting domain-containing protein [Gemmata sp.]|jgi:hypothetical protein|nr:PEP-CTERM sorting domain-containing protein [Gemmata sp.]